MATKNNTPDNGNAKPTLNKESFREAMKTFQFISPYMGYFIFGLIFLFFSSLIFLVFPYLIGLLVDTAQGQSDYDFSLLDIGLGLILVLVLQGTFSYGRVILFANVSERGTADIRKALYKKLVSLPLHFFEENKMGDLISRITSDVNKLYSTFSVTLAEFLRQLLTLIVGVIFLIVSTPKLAFIMLLSFPVIVVSGIFFGRYIRKFSKKRQEKLAQSNAYLGESLQSISVIKSFVNEFFEMKRYNSEIKDVVNISLKYANARGLFTVFIVTILFGALFFIIWQGAVMVQNGTITAGQLIAFVSYTFIIGGSIASLGNFSPEIIGALGATERVREILNTEGEVDLEGKRPLSKLDVTGGIVFKDVQFNYPSRPDIPVLNGINIDIKPGEKIALVGSSGVGKSTIIQLILQFYKINGGDILLDGKSIYDYNIRDFRNIITLVPQDVILFGGTIRENISYGKEDASEEEILEAARNSNSLEFIESFPEGLDTVVGERGVKLSGGQRQRIAIARAILKDPDILLLDEATSALDSESESVVQEALNKLMQGRTSIIIAHRLSTVRDVDRIYVMDEGKVVEEGVHEELMEIENGKYYAQVKMSGMLN